MRTNHWSTPQWLYKNLNEEHYFNFDPCPLKADFDGLKMDWKSSNFVNPPYGHPITSWLEKGYEEYKKGNKSVFLLPVRSCTKWFHQYVPLAQEIFFIKGRLKFGDCNNSAPFPSMVLVFDPDKKHGVKMGQIIQL